MSRRRNLTAGAILLVLLVGYVELRVPVPVGAQGGNAVYRSLRTEIPIAREYLEPQGLQDAAWDILTDGIQVTSATYVNVMSASVTVGELGDAVLVHMRGLFTVTMISPTNFPCMVRIARGTTEIDMVEWNSGSRLLDATFVDAPPVGTHAYHVQIRTVPTGSCTVQAQGGTDTGAIPLPSLLVQSFYAGSIP